MSATRAVLMALLAACSGCAASRAELRTGAGTLPSAWTTVSAADTTIALHRAGGGAIAASVACDAVDEDAPLDVLVNHVLLQLEHPVERPRQPVVLDGRAGLRVRLAVRLDGVAVEIDLVVFKKDGCVVDAQLVAAPGQIDSRRGDFERFLAGLSMSRRRK